MLTGIKKNCSENFLWFLIEAVQKQIIPFLKEILSLIPTIDTVVTTDATAAAALATADACGISHCRLLH